MKKKTFHGAIIKKHYKEVVIFIIAVLIGYIIGYSIGYESGLRFAINKGIELLNRPDIIQVINKIKEIYG